MPPVFPKRPIPDMRPILILFSLVGLLCLCFEARPQEYTYQRYGTRDGLSGSNVHIVAQDRDGYIWLGTETGISRFNGTNFRTFSQADGLPSNEILNFFVDSRNRLWMTPFKDMPCYYQDGQFHSPLNDSLMRPLKTAGLIVFYGETADSTVVFWDDFRVFTFKEGGAVPAHSRPLVYTEPESGVVLKRSSSELSKNFAPSSDRLPGYSARYHRWLYPDNCMDAQRYCLIRGDSVVTVSRKTGRTHLFLFDDLLKAVYLDDTTLALLRRENGVLFWNPHTEKTVAAYLKDYRVQTVIRDRDGNLWFGTRSNGLFRLNRSPFVSYSFDGEGSSLIVNDIWRTEGTLYVSSARAKLWQLKPDSSGNPLLFKTSRVSRGGRWIMEHLSHRMVNYANSDVFRLYRKNGVIDPGVKTVYVSGDTLLIAAFDGVFRFRLPQMALLDTLYDKRATCAFVSEDGCYIGTLGGLYLYKGGKLRFLGDSTPVLQNTVSSMAKDSSGMLWVATAGEGVVGLKDGRVAVQVTQARSGISSDIARCLFVGEGALWIGTQKGINMVALSGKDRYKVTAVYRAEDGLRSEIINALLVEGDIVYAGTEAGLTVFDRSKVPEHEFLQVFITEVAANGTMLKPAGGKLSLPHNSNVRFRFEGVSFLSTSSVRYRYRLKGLAQDWQYTDDPVLNFVSLPSGNYTLQVSAINKFGDKSAVVEQAFEVEQLLWEKRWFRLLTAGSLALIILLLVQLRVAGVKRKEKEQRQIEQQMMQLEQMALRAQMNPHFIFNCLNSIQNFILNQDVAGANFYLGRFASLVRQTLDNAPSIYLSLSEEIKFLTSYLELERLQTYNGFTYEITVDEILDQARVQVPNMVIQPFVENAVKHGAGATGEGGLIVLRFTRKQEGLLECIIEDNGPGFPGEHVVGQSSQLRKASGTSITLKRIGILNRLSEQQDGISYDIRTIYTEQGQVAGTRVIIYFPI